MSLLDVAESAVSTAASPFKLYFAIAAVTALCVAAGGFVWHERSIGATKCETKYDARDKEALAAANATIQKLQNEARGKEALYQKTQNDLVAKHTEIEHAQDIKIAGLQAAARAGTSILRDPAGTCTGHPGQASAPTGAAAGSDGATGCQLSGEVTANLFGEAGRANRIVRQLTLCQQTLAADVKQCNDDQ
ncbi:MAG: hypothetical protein JWN23_1531 [Rhodocyclales bacterium]|nr:hypothetical protein [Rhodocyclales bacterium]